MKTIGAWKGDKAELMVIEKCDRLHHTGMAHPQEIITMQEALLQTITAVMDHKMVIILILWEGLGSHQNFLMISEDEIGNEAQANAAEKGIDTYVKLNLNSIGPNLESLTLIYFYWVVIVLSVHFDRAAIKESHARGFVLF